VWNRDKLVDLARGFVPARTLQSACTLNLFDAIPPDGISNRDLAKSLKIHVRGCETLCHALCALEILRKENNQFFNTKYSKRYLRSDSEDYIGYQIKHLKTLMDHWVSLEQTLKSNQRSKNLPALFKRADEARDFTLTMHTISSRTAPILAENIDLSMKNRLLDIGGGPGTYSIYLAKKQPRLHVTLLDLPLVLKTSKKIVRQFGMSKKFDFYPADYTRDDLPPNHDVALLSHIIHMESAEMNAYLFKKVYDSLKANGLLIIQDYVMNEDLTQPADGALFAMTMLLMTEKGRCYSFKEISGWLKEAGFKRIEKLSPSGTYRYQVVLARKL